MLFLPGNREFFGGKHDVCIIPMSGKYLLPADACLRFWGKPGVVGSSVYCIALLSLAHILVLNHSFTEQPKITFYIAIFNQIFLRAEF